MRGIVTGALVLLAACSGAQAERVQLSGRSEQRPIPVGAFDKVELKGPDSVIVRVGGAPSVSVQGDSAVLDRMDVRVEDGKLVVQRKDRNSNTSGPQDRATVTVSVPRLAAAAVGGSGDMNVDRVSGSRFTAAIGGSGDLRVARVDAPDVEMAIGGSGTIRMAGTARRTEVSIGGSGDVEAGELSAATTQVSVAGSGNATVVARESASVSMVGSGDVTVRGTSNCRISKVGSGNVRCLPQG